MIKVYLAGYSGETEYREYVGRKYKKRLDIFDPMKEVDNKILQKKSFSSITREDVASIVESDKAAIENMDVLVVYIERASFGTAMEILHAFRNDIPIYIIDPTTKWRDDVWVRYHSSKTFDTIDTCFKHILDSIKGF